MGSLEEVPWIDLPKSSPVLSYLCIHTYRLFPPYRILRAELCFFSMVLRKLGSSKRATLYELHRTFEGRWEFTAPSRAGVQGKYGGFTVATKKFCTSETSTADLAGSETMAKLALPSAIAYYGNTQAPIGDISSYKIPDFYCAVVPSPANPNA